MKEYSENELIKRYIDGETEAFGEIYERYRVVLYNFILSLVKDKDLADDIFEEAFIRIIANISRYKEGNFKAFLFKIARNIAIDKIRSKSKKQEILISEINEEERDLDIPSQENIEEDFFKQITANRVYEAIEKLPFHYKEIIYLRHFAQLKFEDISKITNLPLGTVLSHFKRACQRLYKLLCEK